MRIPDFDDIALSDRNAGLKDDTIVNEDPFAEFWGTPSMLREPSIKRFSDEELKNMSVTERRDLYKKCAEEGEIYALRDIISYDFRNYGSSSLEYYLPALTYLYFRTEDINEYESLIREHNYLICSVDTEILDVSEFMAGIGSVYPNLTYSQIDKLEELYNTAKYCQMVDDVLFDKDLLPRKISGITEEELQKTNEDFPDSLLDAIYHAFEINDEVETDDEYTIWQVYVRRFNSIMPKAYNQIGAGECIISGTIDSFIFFRLIEEKYGVECANFYVQNVKDANKYAENISIDDYKKWKSNWVDYKYLHKVSRKYNNSESFLKNTRRIIALSYLLYLNKQ